MEYAKIAKQDVQHAWPYKLASLVLLAMSFSTTAKFAFQALVSQDNTQTSIKSVNYAPIIVRPAQVPQFAPFAQPTTLHLQLRPFAFMAHVQTDIMQMLPISVLPA